MAASVRTVIRCSGVQGIPTALYDFPHGIPPRLRPGEARFASATVLGLSVSGSRLPRPCSTRPRPHTSEPAPLRRPSCLVPGRLCRPSSLGTASPKAATSFSPRASLPTTPTPNQSVQLEALARHSLSQFLWSNIIVSGGVSNMRGVNERLVYELTPLVAQVAPCSATSTC
jgi:hypothetical protein